MMPISPIFPNHNRRDAMAQIPPFENEFLAALAESLRKRSKALRHQTSSFEIFKVYENGDELFEARLTSLDATLTVFAWPERWLRVQLYETGPKKRRVWKWQSEGRPLRDSRAIVVAVEESLAASFGMDRTKFARFDAIWTPLLARGPVALL